MLIFFLSENYTKIIKFLNYNNMIIRLISYNEVNPSNNKRYFLIVVSLFF
jgi:hypothetical protein